MLRKEKVPSSRIRISDLTIQTTLVRSSALHLNYRRNAYEIKSFKGKALLHPKPMNLKGFPKFDSIFTLKRGQEDEFQGTYRKQMEIVYMRKIKSRDNVDVAAFHKGIQYALEKLGKSKFGFEKTVVSKFKSKRHVGSGNELVDYSRAPCLGADQKARGL